jgi:hypothetical protein
MGLAYSSKGGRRYIHGKFWWGKFLEGDQFEDEEWDWSKTLRRILGI